MSSTALQSLTYQGATTAFVQRDRNALGGMILQVAERVARTFHTNDRDALAGELAIYLWRKLNNCRSADVVLDFLFTVARRRAIRLVQRERSKARRRRKYEQALEECLRLERAIRRE